MNNTEFLELAKNDHSTALIHLFDELAKAKAEQLATQETLVEHLATIPAA